MKQFTPAGLKKVFDEADRQFESLPEWKRSGSAQFLAPKRIETERIRVSSTKTDPVKQLTPHTSRSCETCDWKRDRTTVRGSCCDPTKDCSGMPDFDHWRKKQLTPVEEEEYVRSRWNDVMEDHEGWLFLGCHDGDDHSCLNIHEAFLFTEQREAEIADVEEEIRVPLARLLLLPIVWTGNRRRLAWPVQ